MLANRLRQPVASIVTFSPRVSRVRHLSISQWRNYSSSNKSKAKQPSSTSGWIGQALGLTATAATVFLAYTYATTDRRLQIESPTDTKVQNWARNQEELGSQLVQEKRSLKSPGVYLWGSNRYSVVDPESKETVVKTPRRLSYFDGQVLRDLKLDDRSGAAITEKGDLVQWGKGFSETDFRPTTTLTGKNLVSLAMSDDRVLALSSDGNVYSLPIAKADQQSGRKLSESSWLPFWSREANVSYRLLKPSLKLGEKVTAISGGLEHVLLLTSRGRVFSAASATENFPSHGQLGIPGLNWATRPKGPVDACHEIEALKGSKIIQIATGDHHSMVLTDDGRIYTFGDNSFGQLGVEFNPAFPFSDTPIALSLNRLYRGNIWQPKARSIAAGGANSFFTVDAKRILGLEEAPSTVSDLGRVTADTWACGRGIWGSLGNGKWIHLQDAPTKVKTLSGLFEFDERTKQLSPIRLRNLSVGTTHAAAVMDNNTHLNSATDTSLTNAGNWGYDALWWGGNEYFQLGTGKRSNLPKPTYINAPAESGEKDKHEARLQVMPRHKGKVGNRAVRMEQRVECGRHISAIYSAV